MSLFRIRDNICEPVLTDFVKTVRIGSRGQTPPFIIGKVRYTNFYDLKGWFLKVEKQEDSNSVVNKFK